MEFEKYDRCKECQVRFPVKNLKIFSIKQTKDDDVGLIVRKRYICTTCAKEHCPKCNAKNLRFGFASTKIPVEVMCEDCKYEYNIDPPVPQKNI